ncbi:hypothetical protein EDD29_7574 [Actinocorallia herbida]|uniref:Uncharacterized protein n=1 Tax=Actinocorallia herbida TaxID=58109 RepID=A0A3N1D8M3_9ACTN|nr:hypothetical protein [Actinocorallia herbida]ROO89865.1 hypothetical protein EDD29_7574 [Actinocorallia herbida]
MRRIAVLALAVVLGTTWTVPVQAAPSAKVTKKWVTAEGKTKPLKSVKAYGTYTREDASVSAKGVLHDFGKNGWSPGVQFRAWNGKNWTESEVYFRVRANGKPMDGPFTMNYGLFWATAATHFQVREVALKATSTTKGRKYGAWQKLF